MGLKRSCSRAACIGHQHRCLHLQKSFPVQISPDTADNLRAHHEGILHLFVHNQIGISLTVTGIRVGQPVILLRQNLKALGQQRHGRGMDGDFPGLGGKCSSLQSHKITDIQFLKVLVLFLADAVSRHIGLNIAL